MKIRELLYSPEKWTKEESARDKRGVAVPLDWQEACCWCLIGAVAKCYGNIYRGDGLEVKNRMTSKLGVDFIHIWNDSPERTFEDVKKLVEELDV